MKCPHQALVALVDGERFLLMRNVGQIFEPKLEKVAEPELDPTNFSAGVDHQDKISQRHGRTDLNELAHGAAATEWLNNQAKTGKIDQIMIIADPKTLGEMRRHYHKELESRICGEIAKELATEPTATIEKSIASA
ncbi:host attachment protein [Altericroceibacterium endophyticum]|uniref:Attachment protein n=1 Tax=Altericroceibacterium endophyticum TaxID=1808508 RepID=A0A6I4T6L0_9SPHN|nr:host attachment protein [Altericroceibacterium endophyticum]MXO65445.1 attachment protein [Altericroceibacterium endophyticum]